MIGLYLFFFGTCVGWAFGYEHARHRQMKERRARVAELRLQSQKLGSLGHRGRRP